MLRSRVLIVDRSPETREVLRLLIERAGAVAVEANRPQQAVQLAADATPDLFLVDADSDDSHDQGPTRSLEATADRTNTPIVFLGALTGETGAAKAHSVVAKPYHYGPLIRRIEGHLAARGAA
ncbi:MAG: response regulator [Planctomycetota bacterium]